MDVSERDINDKSVVHGYPILSEVSIMEVIINSEKNNKLLNRRELDFTVKYEGPTPSRNDVRNKLAAKLNVKLDLVIIQKMESRFGIQEATGYAKIYEDEARMKEIEAEHIMKKNAAPAAAEEAAEE